MWGEFSGLKNSLKRSRKGVTREMRSTVFICRWLVIVKKLNAVNCHVNDMPVVIREINISDICDNWPQDVMLFCSDFLWKRPSLKMGSVFCSHWHKSPSGVLMCAWYKSMLKIGQQTRAKHVASCLRWAKSRFIKLSDRKNEFCPFSYAKSLYQIYTFHL